MQQIDQQLPFRGKAEGFTSVHVFERGAPTSLGFAALEANQISMIIFIHFDSIRIERYMNVIWKGVDSTPFSLDLNI